MEEHQHALVVERGTRLAPRGNPPRRPARHAYGHISKEGAAEARHMLCEAAWIVVRYPSPLRGFAERTAARRGPGTATVAVARKLVVLFWHLLTKEEDYAFGRPTLKERQKAEVELARQAEIAYRRLVADWQKTRKKKGAGVPVGRAFSSHLLDEETATRQETAPDPAL